jgi:Flp pilus assembly protein TadD
MRLRQYPQAADMFLKAVQIRPGSAEAWTNLGAATLQRGDRARAKLAFEEALRINPQLEPARRGLDAATR